MIWANIYTISPRWEAMPSIHTVWQNYKLAHPNSLYHLFIVFKTKGNLNDHSKELVAMVWNVDCFPDGNAINRQAAD